MLATFVLISQNRLSEIADQRADLDLQIIYWPSMRSRGC